MGDAPPPPPPLLPPFKIDELPIDFVNDVVIGLLDDSLPHEIEGVARFLSLNAGALILIATFLGEEARVTGAGLLVLAALIAFLFSFLRCFRDLRKHQTLLVRIDNLKGDEKEAVKSGLPRGEALQDIFSQTKESIVADGKALAGRRKTTQYTFFAGVISMAFLAMLNILPWVVDDLRWLVSFLPDW